MSMNESSLYIFDPVSPEETNHKIVFISEGECLSIRNENIDIGNGIELSVHCSIDIKTLAYSLAIQSNGKHQFSVMGIKQSIESSDPCIMYTASDEREFQIAISI
jgi:hypothetical protein